MRKSFRNSIYFRSDLVFIHRGWRSKLISIQCKFNNQPSPDQRLWYLFRHKDRFLNWFLAYCGVSGSGGKSDRLVDYRVIPDTDWVVFAESHHGSQQSSPRWAVVDDLLQIRGSESTV